MPSIAMSDSIPSEAIIMKEEKKKSKSKSLLAAETPEIDEPSVKKTKKKKSKDKEASDSDAEKSSKKKDKKRKADNDSDTSSELGEPVNLKVKKKKAKLEEPETEVVEEVKDPNALSNFRISGPLKAKLEANGIKALFPIQAMTFDTILDGCDLVGRARTGQGKTLAFVLPILESLIAGPGKAQRKTGFRRPPSVLVLLPTRELANQVYEDFEAYGASLGLSACCLYGGGGASIPGQQIKLNKGVDIVIGTPGRVKDHLEKGNLNLGSLVFRVLDEADEMLKMGFVDDVELILGKVDDTSKVQTLLFSATLPSWVKNIASRFLKPEKKTVDIVGNDKMKASTSVRHIVLPCSYAARSQVIPDIIRWYGSGGRIIIFTETKVGATELTGLLADARELHGDIQQSKRESTLAAFRSGKFMTLVATDVAARGLDINDVQLIIQCEPPRDIESYIHRSGRTGRAGNTGVAVMLYDPRRSNIKKMERDMGVQFEHVSAPQPSDIAAAAGLSAVETISQISDSVVPAFKAAAEELLNNSGQSAVDLLAKAIAKAVGYTEIKTRSLLTSMENYITVHLESGRPMFSHTSAYSTMRRSLPEEKVNSVQHLTLTADGNGAVFDVPAADVDLFVSGGDKDGNFSIQVLKTLPALQEREQPSMGRFGGRGGGNRFSGGGGNRFSGGGGGRGGGFSDRRHSGGGGRGGGYKKW